MAATFVPYRDRVRVSVGFMHRPGNELIGGFGGVAAMVSGYLGVRSAKLQCAEDPQGRNAHHVGHPEGISATH
jgi:hypothetical protein